METQTEPYGPNTADQMTQYLNSGLTEITYWQPETEILKGKSVSLLFTNSQGLLMLMKYSVYEPIAFVCMHVFVLYMT